LIKEVVKQYFVYGIGSIAQTALGIILLPLYLRLFSPSQYGVISLLIVVSSFLSMFASVGIVSALFRLYYDEEVEERKKLVGNALLWYLLGGAIVGAILYTQATPLSQLLFHGEEYSYTIRLLGVFLFLSMVQAVPFGALQIEKKAGLYVGFSLFRFFVDFGLKLYFIGFLGRGIGGYFESSIIASLVVLCLMIPFVFRYISLTPSTLHLRALFRLGAPYIVNGIAIWVIASSDRLILNHFSGQAAVGVYSLAYTFAGLFTIFLASPINLLIDPFFFSHAARMSAEETKALLSKILIYIFLGSCVLYLAISLGTGDVLQIFKSLFAAKSGYLDAAKFVPLLTLAPMLYFISTSSGLAMLLVKKPGFIAIASFVAAIVSIGLNLVLIPRYGIWGAAVTAAIVYVVLDILCYWWAQRLFHVSYSWWSLFKGVVALAVAFAIGWVIHIPSHPWFSLLARVAAGVIIFGLLVWFASNILTKVDKARALNYVRNMLAARRTLG